MFMSQAALAGQRFGVFQIFGFYGHAGVLWKLENDFGYSGIFPLLYVFRKYYAHSVTYKRRLSIFDQREMNN